MQSSGSCLGIPFFISSIFFLSIQICLIWRSLMLSFVKLRQNLFISGVRHPGSLPQQYPVIVIISEYRKTQSYFHFGIMPLLMRPLQMVSRARVNRNKAKFCRVFCCRNRMDRHPAKNPATIEAFGESPQCLRLKQITALKIEEKLPRNIANDILSFENSRPNNALGLLNIFFKPNTRAMPALMIYPRRNESQKDCTTDSQQPFQCLQNCVF